MSKIIDYFEQNKYVVLQDAVSPKLRDELTNHIFSLKEKNLTTNDPQCPLSDAVYGDPIFDGLLESFAEPIGNQIGRKLIPTYSYARIYRTGEVLKRHKDRESCEISATLTLNYDAKVCWPIFFDEEKEIGVNLEPGEMAVYQGCEILHWRPEFKGNWHVQVFLHYVDANGPHRDWAKDKRTSLGVKKDSQSEAPKVDNTIQRITEKPKIEASTVSYNSVIIPPNEDYFPGYFCIDSNNEPQLKFTNEECDRIIALTKESYPQSAAVGNKGHTIERSIRSANVFEVSYSEETKWIFTKVAAAVSFANNNYFKYDISGITNSLQLIEYSSESEIKGHYDWHIDSGPGHVCLRKISFTAQLSNEKDYTECDLLINNHGEILSASKERGSIHMFPSYMFHRVNPIEKGTRYALVIWIHGSNRFR